MSAWVEDAARQLSAASGGDPERLLQVLGAEWVETEGLAACAHTPGGCIIAAPRGDRPRLLHECGHAALTVGLALHLLRAGSPCWRRQLWREEAIAERFAVAYEEQDKGE